MTRSLLELTRIVCSLLVTAVVILSTSVPASTQPIASQTRARWEKLVYDDAKALIQETTQELVKNPKNAIALRMRSSAYYRNSEQEKGKADAVAALALLSTPTRAEEFEAKWYAERRSEKYDAAILDCTKALELDPKYAWAYYNRANANEGKKEFAKAMADYTKAIELDPGFSDAYNGRGRIFGDNKVYDKAIADLTKVVELDPKRPFGYQSRGYYYNQKNQFDLAIADMTKAIGLDPKLPAPYYQRGLPKQA